MTGIIPLVRRGGGLLVIVAVLAGCPGSPAGAAPQSPVSKFVLRVANASMEVARRPGAGKSDGFRSLLERHGDVGPVARFVLGPYARKLPKDRRAEYYRLVVNFIAGVFTYHAREFAGASIEVRGETERTGDFVIVDTLVTYSDARPSRQLRWRIAARNGRYKIADVSVAGFWLTLQLRSEFVGFLRKNNGSFDALFAALRRSGR